MNVQVRKILDIPLEDHLMAHCILEHYDNVDNICHYVLYMFEDGDELNPYEFSFNCRNILRLQVKSEEPIYESDVEVSDILAFKNISWLKVSIEELSFSEKNKVQKEWTYVKVIK